MMQAPCGTLFLRVTQAYSTLAFLSTGYRNTGEPTAGEPVIVSTCRILTASRGKTEGQRKFCCEEFCGATWEVTAMKVKHNVVQLLSNMKELCVGLCCRLFSCNLKRGFSMILITTCSMCYYLGHYFGNESKLRRPFGLVERRSYSSARHHDLFKC